MAHFLLALKTVAPLFLIIFTGILFSRSKVSSEAWVDVLNKYALYIGFPALVVASLMHLKIGEQSYTQLIILNSVYIVVCMLFAYPVGKLFRFPKKTRRTLFLILPFGNIAYLGIPVLQNALGDAILPVAAIISAVFVFWLLTLALVLVEISGEEQLHLKTLSLNLLKNPLLLSVFAGMILVVFRIQLPVFIADTIQFFSDSVTAVVLFSLGIFLGMQKIGRLKKWYTVFGFVVATMIILPFFYFLALKTTNLDAEFLKASVIDAAMPLGLTPYAISLQYKLDTKLAARIVVLGTLLSVVILPLWIAFLG
ncbi:AEC family transporter [Maribellus mangrovi]|uniref:AEC family transporter n=1 Tax=Maribellus mangrovi TaxID=3133146 RepID=UPI0030EB908E